MQQPDDDRVDSQLRRVEMPPALKDRLRQIGTGSDDDLDADLRHVPLPPKLRERLLTIGTLSDIDLDEELQHVPAIVGAHRADRYWTKRDRSWRAATLLALAGSLLLVASVGYFAVRSMFVAQPADSTIAGQPDKPLDQLRDNWQADDWQADDWDLPAPGSPLTGAESLVKSNNVLRGFDESQRNTALDLLEQLQTADKLPLFDLSSHADEPREKAWEKVLGAPLPTSPGPSFDPGVSRLVVRGLTPPRAKGYDLIFQLKHGVHPYVYPWSEKELAVSPVPLVTETSSFDLVRGMLANRRLPAAYEVRVEDFLAAMPYEFPAPRRDALRLSVAGGPAPFSTGGSNLLQIAVQAKTVRRSTGPTHLVLVVDLSDAMRWDGGWNAARRAVHAAIDRMTRDDRLTFIVFDDRGRKLIEDADRDEAGSLMAALETLSPKGIPNLASGIELGLDAANAALGRVSERSTTLALVAGDQIDVPADRMAELEKRLASLATKGLAFRWIDLSGEPEAHQQLAHMTKAARGTIHRPTASGEVRAALLETLSREPQRVARRAKLRVRFSPKAVAAYRLLGHEATVPAGVIAPPLEVDLYSGDAATGLYEVVLKADGPDEVAVARLDWIDAQTGKKHRKEQKITRSDFASVLDEAHASLQIAALAAEAAELLRGSYFAPPHTHSYANLIELAERKTSPDVRELPAYQMLVHLAKQARQARGSSR